MDTDDYWLINCYKLSEITQTGASLPAFCLEKDGGAS